MAEDLINHFCEIDHFMDKCLKFKHELQAVMASYEGFYKDMQEGRAVEDDLFLH
jgi:hypothetical protein